MGEPKPESIWVDKTFYDNLKTRIIRDRRERRAYQKMMPNQKFYPSFQSATKDLAPELQRFFKQ